MKCSISARPSCARSFGRSSGIRSDPLTLYHVLQVVFAGVVLAVIAERARFLFFVAPLDLKPWLRAVLDAVDEDDLATAAALVERARPALVAEVAHAGIQARGDGEPVGPA